MSRELAGRCGLYCGACSIYRAQRAGFKRQVELAHEFSCQPEQVCCNGCGALTDQCWGNSCAIVRCTAEKGYRFCFECSEYHADTCKAFGDLAERYLKSGEDVRANLKLLQNKSLAQWLERQRKRFTCSNCGRPVTVGARHCSSCGSKQE